MWRARLSSARLAILSSWLAARFNAAFNARQIRLMVDAFIVAASSLRQRLNSFTFRSETGFASNAGVR